MLLIGVRKVPSLVFGSFVFLSWIFPAFYSSFSSWVLLCCLPLLCLRESGSEYPFIFWALGNSLDSPYPWPFLWHLSKPDFCPQIWHILITVPQVLVNSVSPAVLGESAVYPCNELSVYVSLNSDTAILTPKMPMSGGGWSLRSWWGHDGGGPENEINPRELAWWLSTSWGYKGGQPSATQKRVLTRTRPC